MKKLFYLLAVALVAIVLPSCGGSGNSSNSSNANLPEQKVVNVTTAEELVDALANDTRIVIDSKEWLSWDSQINIVGLSNLTIEGKSPERAHIRINDAGSDVFQITNSSFITLKNLKLGHNAPRYECEGLVVSILSSQDVTLDGCKLYGCGLEGVYIGSKDIKNIFINNCDIYECYEEGIDIRAYDGLVENIVVSNTKIHDCGHSVSLWQANGEIKDVVFKNCDISCYVLSDYGQISSNQPVTFQDCKIDIANDFYDEYKPFLNFDNSKISRIPGKDAIEYGCEVYDTVSDYEEEYYGEEDEFLGDDPFPVAFNDDEFPSFDESKLKVVTVHNSDELGNALASNTKIIIDSKEPVSVFAIVPINTDSECRLNNIENLVIEGAGSGVELNTRNEYDDVLQFVNGKNIVLRNLTLGHDVEPGTCDGDVVSFDCCEGVVIDNCKLYGCGVVGLQATGCSHIKVLNSEVYECSNTAISLQDCYNVLVSSTTLRDCPAGVYAGMDYGNIRGVEFRKCVFKALDTPVSVGSWGIRLMGCKGLPSEMDDPNIYVSSDAD